MGGSGQAGNNATFITREENLTMRRLLFAALTLTCAVHAMAAVEYTSANAKVSLNADASLFGDAFITEAPATATSAGYSQITLSKYFDIGLTPWLDVTITNLQAGSALTYASAFLSVIRPPNVSWTTPPQGTMYVQSPANRAFVQTQTAAGITLVDETLSMGGTQSFHLESIGVSGRGFSTYNCGTSCLVPNISPKGLFTLTIRVSSVPELSSGAMVSLGALLMPLAVGLHRRQRTVGA